MACAAKRGLRRDRVRSIPGEATRRITRENVLRRAARRAARPLIDRGWGGARRSRSVRRLRAHVLQQVRSFEKLSNGDPVYAAEILDGFVSHHRLKEVRSFSSLRSGKEQQASDLVMHNLGVALGDVRGTHRQNEVAAKHTALSMAISSEVCERGLASATGRLLKTCRHNMKRAATRRNVIMLDPPSKRIWAIKGRAPRSDRIPQELRDYITAYWKDNTRPSPKAKDKIKGVQKHYLHVSQTELYMCFQEHYESEQKFPGITCPGQRFFENLKPLFVYPEKERSVCCCKYHVEIDLLKRGFNQLRKISHPHGCDCLCTICQCSKHPSAPSNVFPGEDPTRPCERDGCSFSPNLGVSLDSFRPVCHARTKGFDSVRAMCAASLCSKVLHAPSNLELHPRLHRKECLFGNCPDCGFDKKFPMCQPREVDEEDLTLKWSRFEQVPDGVDEKGKPKSRTGIVHKETSKGDFLDYLRMKVPEFARHDFTYRWEDAQFKKSMAVFPVGTVLSVIDYAENYSMVPQDEIQSDYWTSTQVTILVHIIYFHEPDSTFANRKISKVCHYYISDDKKHDSPFVQNAFKMLDTWLHDQGVEFDQHWVWSDGAPTQFKNHIAFYFVARYPRIVGGKMMIWSFFAAGHGKGEHDGMGAVLKRWLRHYQLDRKGCNLENAADIVGLLLENLTLGAHSTFQKRQLHQEQISRVFHHVPEGAVDRNAELGCQTIPGTRNNIFQIMGCSEANHTTLYTRPFACFCSQCVYGTPSQCVNAEYTGGEWEVHQLFPKGTLPPDCEASLPSNEDRVDVSEVGPDFNHLASTLPVDAYFAIRSEKDNAEKVPYYILKCTKRLETLTRDRTHQWGSLKFRPGDTIVTGTYMELAGETPLKYRQTKKRAEVITYSHLVLAINLPLYPESMAEKQLLNRPKKSTAANTVYNLPEEHHEAILQQLAEPSDIFDEL